MFCSNCGKTLLPEESTCPHCGAVLGDDRFKGNDFTSAQARIHPDDVSRAAAGQLSAFTRTDYMSFDNQPEDDLYSNTTYRPLLSPEEELIPEEEEYADQPEADDAAYYEEDQPAEDGEFYDEQPMDDEAAYADEQVYPDEPAYAEPDDAAYAEADEEAYDEANGAVYDDDTPAEEPAYAEEPAEDAYEEDVPHDIPGLENDTNSTPLPKLKPAGISPAVQRYMREQEERLQRQEGRAASTSALKNRFSSLFSRKASAPIEDEEEPALDIPSADDADYADEAYEQETDAQADETAAYDDQAAYDETAYEEQEAYTEAAPAEEEAADIPAVDAAYDETAYDDAAYDEATYDEAAYDEEGYDEAAPQDVDAYDESYYEEGEGNADFAGKAKAFFTDLLGKIKSNRILQIGIAGVLALIVIILGIRWLLYVTASFGTKITGITHATYSQGIELIDKYSSEDYCDELVRTCAVNPTYAQEQMNGDMASLNALLPEEPQENDELFVTTLTILHRAIQTTIKADADAQYNGTEADRAEASANDWLVIRNSVSNLKNATNVSQLSVLSNDVQGAVMPTATPAPTSVAPTATPAPTYTTLKQGVKNDNAVQRMQQRLIDLGYLTGKADGDFGPMTTAAVQAFQTAAGLEADGIASVAMQEALFAADAPAASSEGEDNEDGAPANPAA